MAIPKEVQEIRDSFDLKLKETLDSIKNLSKKIETLRIQQEQLKGGLLALDLVAASFNNKDNKDNEVKSSEGEENGKKDA